MDEEQYRKKFKNYLGNISHLAICELTLFQSFNFHPAVKFIDVEVFTGSFEDGLPVQIFLIDKNNCEVFHKEKNYFPHSSIGLLEFVKLPDWEIEVELDDDNDAEAKIIIEWFNDCWQKSGGQSFELPAYICQHDNIMSFNLKTLEWKDERDDKLKNLGD